MRNISFSLTESQFLAETKDVTRRLGWWVDMEGKLRVEDWFSLELAGEVVAQFSSVNSQDQPPP